MRWADIDALSVLSTPFSDERFVAGLAAVFGWAVRRFDTSAGLSALLVERKTGPLREIVLPPFAPWSALAAPAEDTPDESSRTQRAGLIELCERLRSEGTPALLSLPTCWLGASPPVPGGIIRQRETAVLATGDLETVLSGFSSSSRRTYRKHAEEFGCMDGTQSPTVESDIYGTIELLSSAYARHGRSLPGGSVARLADLATLMLQGGRARIYTARHRTDDQLAAGMIVLHRGTTAWYWVTASVPGPAMTVLVAAVAADLADRGIRTFDLMGANTPSIAEFKRRLGAERVAYAHIVLAGSGLSGLLAGARRTVGALRRQP